MNAVPASSKGGSCRRSVLRVLHVHPALLAPDRSAFFRSEVAVGSQPVPLLHRRSRRSSLIPGRCSRRLPLCCSPTPTLVLRPATIAVQLPVATSAFVVTPAAPRVPTSASI